MGVSDVSLREVAPNDLPIFFAHQADPAVLVLDTLYNGSEPAAHRAGAARKREP